MSQFFNLQVVSLMVIRSLEKPEESQKLLSGPLALLLDLLHFNSTKPTRQPEKLII